MEIHNVKSESRKNRFDVGAHLPGQVKEVVLKKPGPVPLRCKTHTEMRGLIYVTPSPYQAVADDDGRYEITGLPAGRYRIQAWHTGLPEDEPVIAAGTVDLGDGAARQEIALEKPPPPEFDPAVASLRDWQPVVLEIEAELNDALVRWKGGRKSAATLTVMTALSRLYTESGLRAAVSKRLGSERALEHERRFDEIRKQVQVMKSSSPGAIQEVERDIRILVNDLTADITSWAESP